MTDLVVGARPEGQGGGARGMAMRPAARPPPGTELATLPTPLVAGCHGWPGAGAGGSAVKRDDLTGFAFGGNKARPLEFLIGAATADRADTLVTGGAPGSNFCAAAAAAALRAGLRCQLVLAGQPTHPGPALALALSWGATVHWTGSAERETVDSQLPRAAAATGQPRPPALPDPARRRHRAGCGRVRAGRVRAARQLAAIGVTTARVVVAVGSGGTLAGLVAGNAALGRPWTLVGGSVQPAAEDVSLRVLEIARECAGLLAGAMASARGPGGPAEPMPGDVTVVDARGPGHGLPSSEGVAAADQAMRTEGLMVDPVYTAKALSLVPRCADGGDVVFWHTGGLLDTVAAAGARR